MTKPQSTDLPPETVASCLSWARRELTQAGVESPQLTAEVLLSRLLEWDRTRLLTHPNSAVPEQARNVLSAQVRQRCSGVPLQYIVGEQEFFGLPFRVTPAVLIPRPETEILVEKALSLAASSSWRRLRFADVGTGSGCIAVSVAHALPESQLLAIDVSFEALEIARGNAVRHGVADRIWFVCADMTECIDWISLDFLLSNPPYVAAAEYPELPPVVRDHEPRVALWGGESGLDPYARLGAEARRLLTPGGYLLTEIGAGHADSVTRILQSAGLSVDTILEDLRGIPRCVVARKH